MKLIETIKKDLREILSEPRYIHSIGVMQMCEELANIYNIDPEKAKIAGLLHDIAKEIPEEEIFKYVTENKIEINKIEKANFKILHGKVGADIAKKRYNIDEQIQKAIKYHTTTNPQMDTLAKIVYVADKIELNRKAEEYDIEYERELAKKDLDKTVIYIIEENIKTLIKRGKLIDKESIETRNSLLINNT